jgi:PAS domain S-box-containing protein
MEPIDKQLQELVEIIHFTEKVSAKIHGVSHEADIYRIVKTEFEQSKYAMSILLLTDDGSALKIVQAAMHPESLTIAEKVSGLTLKEFRMDLKKSTIYRRVIEGETVQTTVEDVIYEIIPQPIAYAISKVLNYKEQSSILTPLQKHGKIIGALAISSTALAEYFIPSVRSFAQHISTALELSDEYKERKKAEKKLRENEEKFRNIAERNFDAIFEVDLKGCITYISPAIKRMIDYESEEMVGKSIMEYICKENIPAAEQSQVTLLQGGSLEGFQVDVIKRDGSTVSIEINASPIIKDKKIIGSQGVARDVTERNRIQKELHTYQIHLEELVEKRTAALKQMNEQLQKEITEREIVEKSLSAEKERLSVTLRSIGDGVIATDVDGTVVLINQVAEMLTGWTQKEALGKPLETVFTIVNEKTRNLCESPVEKVLNKGIVVGLGNNTILISKDGTEKIIADSGAPIKDKDTIIGVILVFRDITDKRKMEQELLRAQKLESLGNLAGGIAHDFNNILTAVLSNTNLARMYTTDNKVKERLTKIEKASLQAKELTQQLLTFSKGGVPVKKATDIAELIRDSVSFALRGSNVRCHFYVPDTVWAVDVDAGQISQVMNNLIINADQAMPAGGIITVKAENVVVEEDLPLEKGLYVKTTITDQGVGIPDKYVSKVFDPYFTTKQKGSGLGLSTCYSIIKNHDGYITVESEVGVGTTFYVWLPASKEKREKEEKDTAPVTGEGRVLLMDDEALVLDAATEILQYLGYTVVQAKDGKEAVQVYKKALKTDPFDVVIMDLTIPGGVGGREALSELLEIDPSIKAIVSSGYSTDPILANYKDYGFKGAVIKPYSIEELSKTLHSVLTA